MICRNLCCVAIMFAVQRQRVQDGAFNAYNINIELGSQKHYQGYCTLSNNYINILKLASQQQFWENLQYCYPLLKRYKRAEHNKNSGFVYMEGPGYPGQVNFSDTSLQNIHMFNWVTSLSGPPCSLGHRPVWATL